MPKKKQPVRRAPSTSFRKDLKAFLAGVDPGTLILDIEGKDESHPYWDVYDEAFKSFLAYEVAKDVDHGDDAEALLKTNAVQLIVEPCARRAGFVMGFEYCRRLLTGGAR